MQTTKKKPSLIFILVGAVLAGYLGYLINGAWTEGIAFNEFMDRFNDICAVPFANYYNSNTVKAVAIALGIYAMAIVMYYTSQRNYMPGKEFGTARFENPKQVNKILADTCFAAGTGTSAVTQPLENLKTLIIAVIGAVGVIILAKNVMEFAQAYQQQDSSTMNSALKGIVAGVMMAGISTVLTFLGF